MLEVCTAKPDDAATMAALIRRMLDEIAAMGGDCASSEPEAWASFEGELRAKTRNETHLWLITRAHAEPVALLGAELVGLPTILERQRLLHVSAIYVDPLWRRKGLARELLDQAFTWARERGCTAARLNVLVANPARTLYSALGFTELQVEMRRSL